MRTCIKAWMSSNFGQIPLLTWELAVLERLKNRCCHFFSVAIGKIHFKFVGNEDIHNILDVFEFRPGRTTDYGVSCPWTFKKYPHRLIMGKWCFHFFSVVFDWILLILSCNKNNDEFEFPPDQTTDYGVSCPWASKTSVSPLFLNKIWPWHIGLRWALVAFWATCLNMTLQTFSKSFNNTTRISSHKSSPSSS